MVNNPKHKVFTFNRQANEILEFIVDFKYISMNWLDRY